jgi:hypothetical protein
VNRAILAQHELSAQPVLETLVQQATIVRDVLQTETAAAKDKKTISKVSE